jgi:DNA invertase Pin-like site-specific DNA recombinase
MNPTPLSDDRSPIRFLLRRAFDRQKLLSSTTAPIKRAIAFYLRKSAVDPRYLSIGAQLSECSAYAETLDSEIVFERRLYVDRHRSGATMAGREALAEMMEDARAGRFQILVARTGCRLTRNATDAARIYETLAGCGVEIHLVGLGRVQEYQLILFAYSAQRQREGMVEILMEGKRRAAANGDFFGSWPSYRYDRIDDSNGPDWRINPGESDLIRRCFAEIDAGSNLADLARSLNADGLTRPRGGPWASEVFFNRGRGLLDRPVLKGVFVWGIRQDQPVIVPRPDLAIVDAEQFDRVNRRYGMPASTSRSEPRAPFLLGLVRCTCGAMMRLAEDVIDQNVYCRRARVGACDRTTGFSSSIVARQMLELFRNEILNDVRGPEMEAARRSEWHELASSVDAERKRMTTRLEAIARELDASTCSEDEDEEPDPFVAAACCELELEHHVLAGKLADLRMPPFPALDWTRSEETRSEILHVMERLPAVTRSTEDLKVIDLVRSIVSEIDLDIRDDGFSLRVWFGVPNAPPGFDAGNRSAGREWSRSFPKPVDGPLRYPEAVLRHHRRAEAGAFSLDDADWAALGPLLRTLPRLRTATRLKAEAVVFVGITGLMPRYLPDRYATYAGSLEHIRFRSVWPALHEVLRRRGSAVLSDLDRGSPSVPPTVVGGTVALPVPVLRGTGRRRDLRA